MITNFDWLRLLLLCAAMTLLTACEDRPQDLTGIDAALDSSDDSDAGN